MLTRIRSRYEKLPSLSHAEIFLVLWMLVFLGTGRMHW